MAITSCWKRRNLPKLLVGFLGVLVWAVPAAAADPPAAEPAAGTEIVHPADGAVMVYVPGGEFNMGMDPAEAAIIARHLGFKNADELWAWDCYPRRKVRLDGFFIDRTEVTVERWKKFVEATGHRSKHQETTRHFKDPSAANLPAGEVTWEEAKAYTAWAHKSLPSEAQWEKAARGTDGRLYPWGNDPPTWEHGHFGTKDKRPELYVPVGRHPMGASPYGALDMLGNQYEWTSDWIEPYPGNPQAEKMRDYSGKKNVRVRGGSWYHGWISFYAAKRFGLAPDETYYHVGFRTVWTPPADYFGSPQFTRDRAAAKAARARKTITIPRAKAAPTIDGRLDDDCWRNAALVVVEYPYGNPDRTTSPPPMVARFTWDERYLYIGYSVADTDLVAIGTGKEAGPPGNRRPTSEDWLPEKNLDLVEFFVSLGSRQHFWEVHHTAGNHLNNFWCEVPSSALARDAKPTIKDLKLDRERYIPDDGEATVARAVELKRRADGTTSTVNQPGDRDVGYFGEVRLPWAGLGVPADRRRADGSYAMAGFRPSILSVVLNGNDGKATYHSSAADLPPRMFHFSSHLWPTYELAD